MRHAPASATGDREPRLKTEAPARGGSSLPRGMAFEGKGNRALLALLRSGRLQRKARVSEPDDPHEHQADRAAEAVVAEAHPVEVTSASAPGPGTGAPDESNAHDGAVELIGRVHGGSALDEQTLGAMESSFGQTFRDVRVHTGHRAFEAADALQSRAFTVGEDIVFAEGEFAPETTEGRRLLAHELTHVVQQRRGTDGGVTDGRTAERDAREAAHAVVTGGTPAVREGAAPGTVQKELRTVPADVGAGLNWGNTEGTVDWVITADGYDIALTSRVPSGKTLQPRAWENPGTKTLYVDPGASGRIIGKGRWDDAYITHGRPSDTPRAAPPKPTSPAPRPGSAPQKTKPGKEPPARNSTIPDPPQVVPEVIIRANEEEPADPVPTQEADRRPLAEQVVTALDDDPAKAATLAAQLTTEELEQFDAKDRTKLLDALAATAAGGLDVETTLRVLRTTAASDQDRLLDGLVAEHGKVLSALRRSVRKDDASSLEYALVQLQMAATIRSGAAGTGPDLFDPLGAQGFRPVTFGDHPPPWAAGLQGRREANGDWVFQQPGKEPLIVEGLLTRELRAHRLNDQLASQEARHLSAEAKAARIKELAGHTIAGFGEEERIINILHYTSADEAGKVLEELKPSLAQLDAAIDGDNNVVFHLELAALRFRARYKDPNLLNDIAKAPVLPWRDAFIHNRAVFTVRTLADGRVAVTYGSNQSSALETSATFGAAMRMLPKEMQHGGTLILAPDDIVIVNDTDADRQVPLTAADLVAFEHSGDRGLLKHIGTVGSVVLPVGLAARGTIGVGQAALEVGGTVIAITAEEYRLEITKWSPGLARAIDIANIVLALKGSVDLARLGSAGTRAVYSRLKREYDTFKLTRAAKMAASGETNAMRAAAIANEQAPALLRELEEVQSGVKAQAVPAKAGPLVVDLQSGPMVSNTGEPSFLVDLTNQTPGATGIGVEPGDFKLGYQGITPTGQKDLKFSRMLTQNLPEWPVTPGGVPATDWPAWRFDPDVAFPKTGKVVVLQGNAAEGMTPVPQTFFPPVSKTGKAIPANLKDVGGLSATSLPELHGKVDQMYWRRPFGLGSADEATVAAMGTEIDKMLKPGGFVEFRVLPSKDASRVRDVAKHMPGARMVEVPQGAIKSYVTTGTRPASLTDEQWSILAAAGPDIRAQHGALGEGVFNRIIRIYRGSTP